MPEGSSPPPPFKVSTGPLPASRKIHIAGELHPAIRVAMREVTLAPGAGEPPVRIYDPSGPYTDPGAAIDIEAGLKPLRRDWILGRGDVEPYDGRAVRPEDNGLHRGEPANMRAFDHAGRRPLRAKPGRRQT